MLRFTQKFNIMITLIALLIIGGCATTPLKEARTAFNNQQFQESIRFCQQAISADSTHLQAYLLLSESFRRTKALKEAMQTIDLAKKRNILGPGINEETAQIYSAMGSRAVEEKRPRSAVRLYGLAHEFSPENTEILQRLADLNFNLGRTQDARKQYALLIQSKADTTGFTKKLAQIDQQEKSAQTHLKKAVAAYKKNHLKTAKKHIHKALKQTSDNIDILYYQQMIEGRQLYEAGKHVYKKGAMKKIWDAIVAFGTAAQYREKAAEPHYYMGLAYEKKDKSEYVNAINAYQKALDLDPGSRFAKTCKARIRALQAHQKKMEKFWGKKK